MRCTSPSSAFWTKRRETRAKGASLPDTLYCTTGDQVSEVGRVLNCDEMRVDLSCSMCENIYEIWDRCAFQGKAAIVVVELIRNDYHT